MSKLTLVIANKRYSSWSMRPWMVMRAFHIPFDEIAIPLRLPESKELVLKHSPSGRVPALITPELTVWESLAIIEYLAETYPEHPVWPRNRLARARARAISNEMHGGFMPLRQQCPMDITVRFAQPELTANLMRDVHRIEDIWAEARAQFGAGGPYLFGEFSAADAMYAPVVSRFHSFQLPLRDASQSYMATMMADPLYQAWRTAALEETWVIPDYAADHTVVETYS